jgi:hypothetical protein
MKLRTAIRSVSRQSLAMGIGHRQRFNAADVGDDREASHAAAEDNAR